MSAVAGFKAANGNVVSMNCFSFLKGAAVGLAGKQMCLKGFSLSYSYKQKEDRCLHFSVCNT